MSRGGTISVVMARPVIAALERTGIDAGLALRAARVSRAAIGAIENRLPAANMRALWEEAAAATGDRAFGVHLAEAVPRGTCDVIEYIFASSRNLANGLERLTAYIRLMEDSASLRLVVEPLTARVVRAGALATAQFDEFAMTLLFLRAVQSTRVALKPRRLRFQHPSSGHRELERVFGTRVTFGAPQTELVLPRSNLDLPFEHSDSRLLAILERYADRLLAELPSQGTLQARAAHAIAHEMARRTPSLASTASSLHMSARTLQRQLAEHGLTHSGLVDDVRRALALQHIGDAALSITEISYLLHFSDSAAFTRAFTRWTGSSPRRYREQLLHGRVARRDQ